MDGVYETANTATVDLSKVKKVTNNGGGNACGGFVEFKTPGGTFEVSKPNTKALKAWATAPKKGNLPGIDPGKTKVYLRKDSSDNPKIDLLTYIGMGYNLSQLYKGGEGGTPLDSQLAQEISRGVGFVVDKSDVKLRLEKAIGQDIDINGTSDKNGAEEAYKLFTLQYPVSYYKNKTPVSWTPDISATLTPSYWGSWNNTNGKIQFEIDGQNFCKSSLMIINTNTDLGYWYNNTVTSLPTVTTDDLESNWNSFTNSQKGPMAEFIVGSANGNIPPYQIWRGASNGVWGTFGLDYDATSYGSFSFRYDLGNDFAHNNIWSTIFPDGARFELPVARAGKYTYEQIAPLVPFFLDKFSIGAGFTDTSWKDQVNETRNTLETPTIQETTNILLDIFQGIGTLFETRPDVRGPTLQQNNMQEQSAAPADSNN